jgi:serine phosphatase RsbU (regulator of sigma subunit)
VGWLNDLVHHVGPEHTASVVAGYFDPPTRVLTWAQAGHPPPVLVRGPVARALDQPAGVLLGAGRSGYEAASLAMEPGDLLLLYSDGLIERRHRSLEEGLAALTSATAGVTDPEQVINVALGAIGSEDTEDDTCLVALRVG